MKKARGCGLSCWSECTDLNRGPLVPQEHLGGVVRGGGGCGNAYEIRVCELSIVFGFCSVHGSFGGCGDQAVIQFLGDGRRLKDEHVFLAERPHYHRLSAISACMRTDF